MKIQIENSALTTDTKGAAALRAIFNQHLEVVLHTPFGNLQVRPAEDATRTTPHQ